MMLPASTAPDMEERSLSQGALRLGVDLDGIQQQTLLRYTQLLQKWNRVYNLTAVREPARMISHHLLDSLSIAPHIAHGSTVLDVGSGPGLPGIPLAIARPDISMTLLDSNHKKAAFMQQALLELKIGNADVMCKRVEDWRTERCFGVIVSRAFAELAEFVRVSAHLLCPGGVLMAMKGVCPEDEIGQLPADFQAVRSVPLNVPGLDAARHLVILQARHPA